MIIAAIVKLTHLKSVCVCINVCVMLFAAIHSLIIFNKESCKILKTHVYTLYIILCAYAKLQALRYNIIYYIRQGRE